MKSLFLVLSCFFSIVLQAQSVDSVLSDGHMIYFQVQGKGEPLYMLTGGPALDPVYIRDVASRLADSNQIIVIHQRGTGLTQVPPDPQSINIDQYCRDIHAVKEKLKHTTFILLGHSWGGMLAMHYATLFPADLKKLLLVSSGGCNLQFYSYFSDNLDARLSKEKQDSVRLLGQQFDQLSAIPGDSALQLRTDLVFDLFNMKGPAYFHNKSFSAKQKLTRQNFNLAVNQSMIGKLFQSRWDLRDALANVNIPTLIILGRQDPIDLETALLIRDAIPGSKLEIIERCGHFPWVEQPEVFYRLVGQFVRA